MIASLLSEHGGFGLAIGYFIKSWEDGIIGGSTQVKEGTSDGLDAFSGSGIECFKCICGSILYGRAIMGCSPLVWCMLGT